MDLAAAPLAAFSRDLGAAREAPAAWGALHALFAHAIGAALFTVTTVDLDRGQAKRLYTSDAKSYPVSGAKPIEKDPFYDQVIVRHETFVQNTLADIAGHFPDHALIGSLGLGSVVNLPVLFAGSVVATVNCLDAPQRYTRERVGIAEALRTHALAAWLAARAFGQI